MGSRSHLILASRAAWFRDRRLKTCGKLNFLFTERKTRRPNVGSRAQCIDSLRMADDDQKLKAARERMSRLREEAKDVEIARIQHAIKALQKQRNELRLARFRKRGCQEESLAASTLDPLVAQRVAEPFTPRKQGAKHERSPNLSSGNGREKSGKPLEPQAPPTSKRLSPRAILTESPLRSTLKQSPPRSPPERPMSPPMSKSPMPPRSSPPSPLHAFDFLTALEQVCARGSHCASHCACAVFSR